MANPRTIIKAAKKCSIVGKEVKLDGVRVDLVANNIVIASETTRKRCSEFDNRNPLCPVWKNPQSDPPVGCPLGTL
jgi:hypothetical protein